MKTTPATWPDGTPKSAGTFAWQGKSSIFNAERTPSQAQLVQRAKRENRDGTFGAHTQAK